MGLRLALALVLWVPGIGAVGLRLALALVLWVPGIGAVGAWHWCCGSQVGHGIGPRSDHGRGVRVWRRPG